MEKSLLDSISLLQDVRAGCGAHPAPYSLGIVGSFLGVRRLGREANHSAPSNSEAKNEWSRTSTPTSVFMACTKAIILSTLLILKQLNPIHSHVLFLEETFDVFPLSLRVEILQNRLFIVICPKENVNEFLVSYNFYS